jgi:hypothetical protein
MTVQRPLLPALFLATGSLTVTGRFPGHDPDGRALVSGR